jgi:prolyl oligopeptidase
MAPRAALVMLALSGCVALQEDRVLKYPEAPVDPVVEEHHGVRVEDPYRWLEELDSPETRGWIDAQNRLTFDFLAKIPARERLKRRITELWDYEKYGVPFRKGGRYFFTRNDGLQNQSVLYVLDRLDGEPRALLDPNALSEDGTVALTTYAVSENGRLLAYALSAKGSDWLEWKVRDIDTGRDLADRLRWSKFSGASWTHDSAGFFYSRYDAPAEGAEYKGANYHHKLYYHRIGDPQEHDRLVYERPDEKEWGFGGAVTDDGTTLLIVVWKGTHRENLVFLKDLARPDAPIVELIREWDADYSFVDKVGATIYFKTDLDAPMGRVIAVDLANPDRSAWREVIPESREALEGVGLVDDRLVAAYLQDAHSRVRIFDLEGKPVRDVELPGKGTAVGFGGRREDKETFFAFTSFTAPGTIYRYDMPSGRAEVFREPKLRFDPADYEVKQVFYASRDGTRVPMFLTHKKGIRLDGGNPVYLYGYGGFNISLTPAFSVSVVAWMETGGVFAQPNIRGGGEYGKPWHEGGMKLRKQNCFDDFIAAAEWLIANGYTRRDKLAIGGASNGGLLVGACMTQRPDLFAACVPAVGVLDMLRFHKFTIGWAWTSDYGSPDNAEEFRALLAYSPYHNLKPGTRYPATLVVTADHDDRVYPGHSFKFAARLQACQAPGGPPTLIRIDVKAGHGMGKPTSKVIEEAADRWAFLTWALGVE